MNGTRDEFAPAATYVNVALGSYGEPDHLATVFAFDPAPRKWRAVYVSVGQGSNSEAARFIGSRLGSSRVRIGECPHVNSARERVFSAVGLLDGGRMVRRGGSKFTLTSEAG